MVSADLVHDIGEVVSEQVAAMAICPMELAGLPEGMGTMLASVMMPTLWRASWASSAGA